MTATSAEPIMKSMWISLDLLRDGRCVFHSCTVDRNGNEGDFKLDRRARNEGPRLEDAYRAAIRARIDWEPTGPFHLFAIEVESAGFVIFAPERYSMTWDPARGTRRWNQRLE